jgi:hypothetical protein
VCIIELGKFYTVFCIQNQVPEIILAGSCSNNLPMRPELISKQFGKAVSELSPVIALAVRCLSHRNFLFGLKNIHLRGGTLRAATWMLVVRVWNIVFNYRQQSLHSGISIYALAVEIWQFCTTGLSHWGHFCFEQILYFDVLYNFHLLLEVKITRCGALHVFAISPPKYDDPQRAQNTYH